MSLSPTTANKKKITAASADQFEDADEAEDFSFPTASREAAKTAATNAADKIDGASSDAPEKEESDSEAEVPMKQLNTKMPVESPTAAAAVATASVKPPIAQPSAAPAPKASPLDALAFACVAEEQSIASSAKSATASTKPPPTRAAIPTTLPKVSEGTRVAADEISCTDGEYFRVLFCAESG